MFAGEAGSILRHAIHKAFGTEFAPYLTNVVKYRPKTTSAKGNRAPTREECDAFRPVLMSEIESVQPSVILSLGNTAGMTLSQKPEFHVTHYMGKHVKLRVAERLIMVFPCVHPNYVLRNGGVGTIAWNDFYEVFIKMKQVCAL